MNTTIRIGMMVRVDKIQPIPTDIMQRSAALNPHWTINVLQTLEASHSELAQECGIGVGDICTVTKFWLEPSEMVELNDQLTLPWECVTPVEL